MNKIFTLDEAEQLDNQKVKELYKKYINPYQTKIFSSFPFGEDKFIKAEGMYMYTENNKKILDFTGGLGVLGLGHNHPRILKVRQEYSQKKKMEVHKLVFSNYLAALSNNISTVVGNNLDKVFFCNSGAEAIEAAIKISSRYNNKKKYILSSNKSYHGKLIGSGSISGSYQKKNKFPKMENVKFYNFNDINSLEKTIIDCNADGGVYAIVIEVFSATLLENCSKEFISKLCELRKKYDFLIICDEVYSAWFKCGYFFYYKKFDNFVPDILVLSKSLGGGKSSIASIITRSNIYEKVYGSIENANLHTTTYNGFGEECATALEAINVMMEEKFHEKVIKIDQQIKKKLTELKDKYKDKITSIKGEGALWGIEFNSLINNIGEFSSLIPLEIVKNKTFFLKKILAASISAELYSKHNILSFISESENSNFLYVSPSLIVDKKEIDYFFESLDKVLQSGLNAKLIKQLIKSIISVLK